jgi:hypothetical protein
VLEKLSCDRFTHGQLRFAFFVEEEIKFFSSNSSPSSSAMSEIRAPESPTSSLCLFMIAFELKIHHESLFPSPFSGGSEKLSIFFGVFLRKAHIYLSSTQITP